MTCPHCDAILREIDDAELRRDEAQRTVLRALLLLLANAREALTICDLTVHQMMSMLDTERQHTRNPDDETEVK